ncbi:MAG: hypothetical protein OSA92_11335 [Pirellulaceae bacterium]|nr:hypothetical protein [Pirellulaceae bacterium]
MSNTQETLNELSAKVQKLRKGIQLVTRLMLVLSVGALIYAAYFFQYFFEEIEVFRQPKTVVALAFDLANGSGIPTSLSDTSKLIEETVRDEAPALTQVASENFKLMLPEMRQVIENYAIEEMDLLLAQGAVVSAEQFGNLVDNHKDTIQSSIRDLSQSGDEALAKATIDALAKAIGDEINADLQEEAAVMMGTLYQLNDKLGKLAAGDDLTAREQAERKTLMLMKRVLLEHADPALAGKELPNQETF